MSGQVLEDYRGAAGIAEVHGKGRLWVWGGERAAKTRENVVEGGEKDKFWCGWYVC